MKSRIQTSLMLVVAGVMLSNVATVSRIGPRVSGSSVQELRSNPALRLPMAAPQLGPIVPPCPTGMTCN